MPEDPESEEKTGDNGDKYTMLRLKMVNFMKRMGRDFDAVQLVASRYIPESDTTEYISCHHGNLYTRLGMVGAWMRDQDMADGDGDEDGEGVHS